MKNKWNIVEGDIDYVVKERFISGRITKKRWKKIDSFCRGNTKQYHCHHDFDCCGCVSSEYYEVKRIRGGVKLTHSIYFNY